MIKNIGKLKQWTGEKFGSAKTTLQTEDFQRLEVETDRKRIAYEKLHAAAGLMQIQLAKKKISPEDNKSKRLPNDILGVCFSNYGSEFTDPSTPLAVAVGNFGQAQTKLGSFQEEFAELMKQDYLEKLEDGLTQFKEYQALRRKLESRRLDYDAKLGRLQKSKKENPGLEQEMQAAKIKYEDSEYDVIQKMASLQEFEDEHCEALSNFLEIQFEYFNRSLEVLNEVRSNWGTPTPTSVTVRPNNNRLAGLSRTSSNNSDIASTPRLATSRKGSVAGDSLVPPVRRDIRSASFSDREDTPPSVRGGRGLNGRSPSFSDREDTPPSVRGGRGLNGRSSSFSDREASVPPPVLPRRTSPVTTCTTQRKAVYDFGGDNADELSFRIGDLITVIEEVDEGWWLGEVDGRRGIFPVNYTELVVAAGPPMPARPSLSSTNSMPNTRPSLSSNTYIAEHPDEYVEEEPSPFGDANRSTLSSSPMHSPRPAVAAASTKRAPPPPPSSRSPPVTMQQSRSFTTNNKTRTAPSTPLASSNNDYFDSDATPSCGDCGCTDFTANIFKKGHCNNCFHKHY